MSIEITKWRKVTRGFPQGSGLRPLLFNIYVRKLPAVTSARTFQFADDLMLKRILISWRSNCYIASTKPRLFVTSNQLVINASKSQLTVFEAQGKRLPADFALKIEGCKITPAYSVELLRVTLDWYLTFSEHTDDLVKKCHGLIGVLANAALYLTRQLLRLVYVSLMRSQLDYCSTFASAAPSQLRKLNTVQKISARIICGVPRDAHSAPLLESLHLESLESRHTNHVIKTVEPSCSETVILHSRTFLRYAPMVL